MGKLVTISDIYTPNREILLQLNVSPNDKNELLKIQKMEGGYIHRVRKLIDYCQRNDIDITVDLSQSIEHNFGKVLLEKLQNE